MNDKQFGFRKMRRSGSSNITIANLLGISRQAVSRSFLVMDEKIETTLREMAQTNQIAIDKVNAERGVVLVIVLEKKRLVPALAGSVSLMRKTWRELLGCAVIFGAIVLGDAAIALVIGQSPYLLNLDFDFFINMSRGQLMMMTVCFLFFTGCWVMMAAGFTAAGIAITDLYGCGKTGHVRGGNNSHPITTTPVKDQSASESRSDILNR